MLGSPFPRPSWPLVFWPHVNSWPSERENDREAKVGYCLSPPISPSTETIYIGLVLWDYLVAKMHNMNL